MNALYICFSVCFVSLTLSIHLILFPRIQSQSLTPKQTSTYQNSMTQLPAGVGDLFIHDELLISVLQTHYTMARKYTYFFASKNEYRIAMFVVLNPVSNCLVCCFLIARSISVTLCQCFIIWTPILYQACLSYQTTARKQHS